MVKRLTLRTRNPYNTNSNRRRVVKTPGARLLYQRLNKTGKGPICGDTGAPLLGIPHFVRKEGGRLSHRQKTVTRPYGGVLCSKAVRERIVRAFLSEEHKLVKSLMKVHAKKEKMQKKKERRAGHA